MGQLEEDEEEQEEADAPAEQPAAFSAPARGASTQNRQRIQEGMLSTLKELRSKKGTLDVVHTILSDDRVKVYAHMIPGCI